MRLSRDERDELAERDYRDDVQRQVDDAEAKRAASGISPEVLSLMDAAAAGRKAGMYGHGASMNPYDHATPEYAEWDRQRLAVIGYRLASSTRKVA